MKGINGYNLGLVLLWLMADVSFSFTSREPFALVSRFGNSFGPQKSETSSRSSLVMRDLSACYWFKLGDSVRVIKDVTKAGCNLRGRFGKVLQVWEKCDIDPTCCCAEQVDLGMAVRVEFEGTEADEEASPGLSFYHYFAEDELVNVNEQQVEQETTLEDPVAFDGLSCKAFKLDRLKMGQQARRLADFEASRASEKNQSK
jgi:hypothetical protein